MSAVKRPYDYRLHSSSPLQDRLYSYPTWQPTPWWHPMRWIGFTWRLCVDWPSRAHGNTAYDYQTTRQRARHSLAWQFNNGDLGRDECQDPATGHVQASVPRKPSQRASHQTPA